MESDDGDGGVGRARGSIGGSLVDSSVGGSTCWASIGSGMVIDDSDGEGGRTRGSMGSGGST